MARGNIITILGFWLILISILSLPSPLQSALVVATAIGLIIISYVPKKSTNQSAPLSRAGKTVIKNTPPVNINNSFEPQIKRETSPQVKTVSEDEFNQKPNNTGELSGYTAQGVNVRPHNDL